MATVRVAHAEALPGKLIRKAGYRSWQRCLPLDTSVTNRILATIRDAIVANVDGILAMSAVEALLYGIIFWIAGCLEPPDSPP